VAALTGFCTRSKRNLCINVRDWKPSRISGGCPSQCTAVLPFSPQQRTLQQRSHKDEGRCFRTAWLIPRVKAPATCSNTDMLKRLMAWGTKHMAKDTELVQTTVSHALGYLFASLFHLEAWSSGESETVLVYFSVGFISLGCKMSVYKYNEKLPHFKGLTTFSA